MPGKTRMYARACLSHTFNAAIIDRSVFSAPRMIAMGNCFRVKALHPMARSFMPVA